MVGRVSIVLELLMLLCCAHRIAIGAQQPELDSARIHALRNAAISGDHDSAFC